MRTVYDNISIAGVIQPVQFTTGLVATGAAVDTRGFSSAAIRVFATATASTLTTPQGSTLVAVLQESADASTWTTATDVGGTNIGFTLTATTAVVLSSARVEGLGLNRLRYLRVQLTPKFNGSTTAATVFTASGVIELGRGYNRPVLPATASNT